MSYVIWMVVLTVIAALLFTAQRTFPETRDYRGSTILLLASLLKPGGFLINQEPSRFQQTGEEKYRGSPVITGLWEGSLGCEKERSDHRKDDHPDDIRHR